MRDAVGLFNALPRVVKDAVSQVADEHHITQLWVMGDRQFAVVSAARQQVWLQLRELGYSYPVIGEFFGRDHVTVLYGVRSALARAGEPSSVAWMARRRAAKRSA